MHSRNKKIVVLSTAIIAFLVFFSTVQFGLSAPIATPVIVKMDNTPGTNLAIETLTVNMPNAYVVDYNSPIYYLVIGRACGGVIWVGHGSQQGMETNEGLITWQTLAAKVEGTPSKDAVLACYSAAILKYVPNDLVLVSFNGEIDAKIGALLTSYALTGNQALLGVAIQQLLSVISGKAQLTPLRVIIEPGDNPPPPPTQSLPAYRYASSTGGLTDWELMLAMAAGIDLLCGTILFGGLSAKGSDPQVRSDATIVSLVLDALLSVVITGIACFKGERSPVDFAWALMLFLADVLYAALVYALGLPNLTQGMRDFANGALTGLLALILRIGSFLIPIVGWISFGIWIAQIVVGVVLLVNQIWNDYNDAG